MPEVVLHETLSLESLQKIDEKGDIPSHLALQKIYMSMMQTK